ncbi:tetratricopeptide repeat protein [Xenorhabdus bovienii]|uniref:tetratricopeptide repeat protein n=1 Tax=Xenorhabdus bovienii TaxID=40576 RepID=UPI0023B351F8|nr:tetratricopeptide repeat protein [Xenorhabdus bovienii]MDE9430804.1 sel1 repeat family protein [Xenorhabdus bovienii]MDE9488447.1 sel1 repeat family protein [Xenorhabdus bovienii]MDE9504826.1 sel1 repeat family protein [Xenorhabdus bovienii]MDE9546266.1 sel1 repeat family protein [Xenorhabdus bovienii]
MKGKVKKYLSSIVLMMALFTNGFLYASEVSLETLRFAAIGGDAKSQTDLGAMYFHGQGVKQDYQLAKSWFEKAAQQNSAEAENYLGVMYMTGKGTPENIQTAIEWFEKSANQNFAKAQNNLGLIYFYNNENDNQNLNKARGWFEKAAQQNIAISQYQRTSLE